MNIGQIIFANVADTEVIEKYIVVGIDKNGCPTHGVRLSDVLPNHPEGNVTEISKWKCFNTRKEAYQHLREHTKHAMDLCVAEFEERLKCMDQLIASTND